MALPDMLKLNLGCGRDTRSGWVNIDLRPGPGVDMVMDLSEPLPFPDNSIEEIYASHVLEHILHWEKTVEELHRVLKPGRKCEIIVPYLFAPAPYHYRFFQENTINAFCKGTGFDGSLTLEGQWLFHLDKSRIDRLGVLEYHLKKYLGIKLAWGKKYQIVWELTKLDGGR